MDMCSDAAHNKDWQCFADLEFQKGHNKALDGQGMVDRLLELVAQQLKVSNCQHSCCVSCICFGMMDSGSVSYPSND